MYQRLKILALGAGAFALIGTSAVVNNGVFAQESTPAAESTPAVGSAGETETSAYDGFVALVLAANLGISDPATVDTAVKETLKQRVDEQLAAGEISANEATARKERIDGEALRILLWPRWSSSPRCAWWRARPSGWGRLWQAG